MIKLLAAAMTSECILTIAKYSSDIVVVVVVLWWYWSKKTRQNGRTSRIQELCFHYFAVTQVATTLKLSVHMTKELQYKLPVHVTKEL